MKTKTKNLSEENKIRAFKLFVDEYSEKYLELKRMEDEVEDLKELLLRYKKEELWSFENNVGEGNVYYVTFVQATTKIYDIVTIYKKIGIKKFLEIISIVKKKALEVMTEKELDSFVIEEKKNKPYFTVGKFE